MKLTICTPKALAQQLQRQAFARYETRLLLGELRRRCAGRDGRVQRRIAGRAGLGADLVADDEQLAAVAAQEG
jgi:hypothetical protein